MSLRIVRFTEENSARVMELSDQEDWSFQYVGDDEYVFTDEQLQRIRAEGIPFQEVGTGPSPKKRASLARPKT